jgi:hypothetical protein
MFGAGKFLQVNKKLKRKKNTTKNPNQGARQNKG